MPAESVAVLAFEGISPFHLAVPCAVFGEDRSDDGIPRFDFRICTLEPGPVRMSVGLAIDAAEPFARFADADVLIVPSWNDIDRPAPAILGDALRAAHARGATIVGLCLGAFPVADSGLLDGRRATTHWRCADRFAARFPRVRHDVALLYIDEDRLLTSAGTAAGLDCCLHLVRRMRGADQAAKIARRLVVPPHRQGSQAQYIEHPLPPPARDGVGEALQWAVAHLDAPLDVDALAERAHMSRRNFTRRFRELHGTSVARWLVQQRIARAQQLLESTTLPVERIAMEAGFGSAQSLRQHFLATLRTTPGRYRQEFAAGNQYMTSSMPIARRDA